MRRGTLLIVDDESQNVRLLSRVLKEVFQAIESTTDSRNARELYQALKPDLILLDLSMPNLDGFQVMEQLREIEKESYLPVIVLTGMAEQDKRNKALALGAKDFITKPFDLVELRTRVMNALEVRLLHNDIRDHRNRLETYVNPGTRRVARLQREEVAHSARRTILFSDLRGFTSFSERQEPSEVFRILDEAIEVQGVAIESNHGEVDKFIGDCVMGVFEQSSDACHAAAEIIRATKDFLGKNSCASLVPGIGIHCGQVVEGIIGKRALRSFTLIGDAVNVASRLSDLAASGTIVISLDVFDELSPQEREPFVVADDMAIRGRANSVSVRLRNVVV